MLIFQISKIFALAKISGQITKKRANETRLAKYCSQKNKQSGELHFLWHFSTAVIYYFDMQTACCFAIFCYLIRKKIQYTISKAA